MTVRRSFGVRARALGLSAVALALAPFVLVPACSTGAVGVDACRAIESARCDAVPACEGDDPSFGIVTEEQIRNCKVFYNDHCLHGLENTEEDPSQDTIDDCVAAVALVAQCQRDKVDVLVDCERLGETEEDRARFVVADAADASPCEALERPELIADCAFVATPEEEE